MNTKTSRLFMYGMVIFCALTFFSTGETAPVFPTKPITVICQWAAGGSSDLTLRGIAKGATELLGQPVIVINKLYRCSWCGHEFSQTPYASEATCGV